MQFDEYEISCEMDSKRRAETAQAHCEPILYLEDTGSDGAGGFVGNRITVQRGIVEYFTFRKELSS